MIFIDTQNKLEDHINDIYKLHEFALDTETTGLDPYSNKLLLVQLGDFHNQYIIDARKVNIHKLKNLIEDTNRTKIGVNLSFDYKFLLHHTGINIEYSLIDLMIAEKLLLAGLVYMQSRGYFALDDLSIKYTNNLVTKNERLSFVNFSSDTFSHTQLQYALQDIIKPLEIWEKQKLKIKEKNLFDTLELECKFIPVIGDMELNGVYLDQDMWLDLAYNAKSNLIKSEKYLRSIFDTNINIFGECDCNFASSKQLLELLNSCGHNIKNTSDQVLRTLPDDISEPIIKYRKYEKAVNSFGKNYIKFINSVTNRVHASINSIGASTGRLSADSPNFMQIPKKQKYRSCFKAENNGKIITSDYSGQEVCIICETVKEPMWLEILSNGQDLHSVMGTKLFGVEVSKEVNNHLRNIFKNMLFGLAYGAGTKKVMMFFHQAGLSCDYNKAQSVVDKFFELSPKVKTKLTEIGETALTLGESRTLGNRPRFFDLDKLNSLKGKDYDFEKQKIIRESRNHIVQGSGSDYLKTASIILRNFIKKHQLKLKQIMLVHDEKVTESLDDHEHNKYYQHLAMILGQQTYQKHVPAKCDIITDSMWRKD